MRTGLDWVAVGDWLIGVSVGDEEGVRLATAVPDAVSDDVHDGVAVPLAVAVPVRVPVNVDDGEGLVDGVTLGVALGGAKLTASRRKNWCSAKGFPVPYANTMFVVPVVEMGCVACAKDRVKFIVVDAPTWLYVTPEVTKPGVATIVGYMLLLLASVR